MPYSKLARALLSRVRNAEGQALAEYGLILGLVFVAAAVGLALLGGAVTSSFAAFIDAAGWGGS